MLTILADYTNGGRYVALIYDTEGGFGVVAGTRSLGLGKNYAIAREVYALECKDAGAPTFENHEAPTC